MPAKVSRKESNATAKVYVFNIVLNFHTAKVDLWLVSMETSQTSEKVKYLRWAGRITRGTTDLEHEWINYLLDNVMNKMCEGLNNGM